MRLVLIHQYFWPDPPPYASMLRAIAADLGRRGHDVRVLAGRAGASTTTGAPTAASRAPRRVVVDGVSVERLPQVSGRGLRQAVNLVVFPAVVAARVLTGRRADVVMCSTAPQVTLGAFVSLAARARRSRFVYHCMDLHPEIGRLSGEFANPITYRLLARIDAATMRRASAVVVLSEDMARSVASRDPALSDKVVVLNNFALPQFGDTVEAPLPAPEPGVLRVVFTGNLGRFQGLEDLVAAVRTLPDAVRVELVFMGDGVVGPELERAGAELADGPVRIVLVPRGPVALARALMRTAHVGVVSLVLGVVAYAYPSKVATYAEEGLPILAVVEPGSELARTVEDRGLGWTAAPGDIVGIAAALVSAYENLVSDPSFAAVRDRVRRYATAEFAQDRALPRWAALVDAVTGSHPLADV
ncbi:MAG: glycosyltransferase family 4 protein [Dermatophilaceae bacterium]|jgi:glycosyltransferase involved in cell wall biosynthesis